MKVLVDALPLGGITTGISRYVRSLYQEMEKLSSVQVEYFDGRGCKSQMPEAARYDDWSRKTARERNLPEVVALGLRSIGWLLYERRLRRAAENNGFQVYHETNYVVSAIRKLPQILTIHDLSLLKYRNRHPRSRVWFSDLFFRRRLRYAFHILTVSDFIRSEVCGELGVSPGKVTAVPLAQSSFFYPRNPIKAEQAARNLGLPKRYFLFVGTLEPRKNLPLLLEAEAVCKAGIPLVLAGWDGWGDAACLNMVKGHGGVKDRVYRVGYVDEETLACLYSNAVALVFPSLYEGFGLPILEAMACGCPVISSTAASLPEVAGDAALFIDPHSVRDLVAAMEKLVNDEGHRKNLSAKGLLRSKLFSWRKAAEKTLTVFRRVHARAIHDFS